MEPKYVAVLAVALVACVTDLRSRRIPNLLTFGAATAGLYGIGEKTTDYFGRQCLNARRLVERGVRFVQLYSGGGHQQESWDAHYGLDENHRMHCAETDKPIAGLLRDLKASRTVSPTPPASTPSSA